MTFKMAIVKGKKALFTTDRNCSIDGCFTYYVIGQAEDNPEPVYLSKKANNCLEIGVVIVKQEYFEEYEEVNGFDIENGVYIVTPKERNLRDGLQYIKC